MAHKTLVNGTAYEITGGIDLIGGTAYKQKKGRTLVGGTGYDVLFVHPVSVSVTGEYNSKYSYFSIDGEAVENGAALYDYSSVLQSTQTLSVFVGGDFLLCSVTLNRKKVQSGNGTYIINMADCGRVSITFDMVYISNKFSHTVCEISTWEEM